jgi:hypothetical protein
MIGSQDSSNRTGITLRWPVAAVAAGLVAVSAACLPLAPASARPAGAASAGAARSVALTPSIPIPPPRQVH